MTAPHIVDPASLLGEALSQASPDLMRQLLQTTINALLSADADAMSDAIDTLQDAVDAAKALPSESEKAVAFHDNVLPAMDALRAAADDAETICGEDYWPLPSYSKMLYYV